MKKITSVFTRLDQRGLFIECANGEPWQSVNSGKMRKGAVMGHHYHKKSRVLFFLLSGSVSGSMRSVKSTRAKVKKFNLTPNQGIIFEPYETHALTFTAGGYFILLKTKAFSLTNPDIFPAKV